MSEFLTLIEDGNLRQKLALISQERAAWLDWKPFREMRASWQALPEREAGYLSFEGEAVTIGEQLAPQHPEREAIAAVARALIPWKKGPFRLFGMEIDAEWRGDLKWNRLAPALPDLQGQVILDIGANNGYYLFRMLPRGPRLVLGIDPFPRLWYQFHLLQRYARAANLEFQMWGWQQVALLPEIFDTVFCMGIIYHHFNPIQILKDIHRCLKPGGTLMLESIVIPGDESRCLFPRDRYARMRNVWFIPTVAAMVSFLERTRFREIQQIAVNAHDPGEQRTTAWNPGLSYGDFLHPGNAELTVEGHPAPLRALLSAKKVMS